VTRKLDGLRQCRTSCGGEDALGRNAGREQRVETLLALDDAEGLPLAGGAERRNTVNAGVEKQADMGDEADMVDIAAAIEGRQRRAPDATDCL
jgi:hypothetical protein